MVFGDGRLNLGGQRKEEKAQGCDESSFSESGKRPRFHRGKLYIDGAIYGNT